MNDDNSILFLGDVIPYKTFKFKDSYKTIINLECPIIDNGIPITGKINFSVKENHLEDIFNTNLLAVNLGNNHILDYGLNGLNSTMKELERTGINYFGINNPENDSHNPLILEFNNEKIAFFSAIHEKTLPLVEFDDFNYLSLLNFDELTCKISKIRDQVKRVVIYVHWGVEESSYPSREDISMGRKLIDSGADVIIGSHAHAPQPVEKYKNGIIAYNLGNFIMPIFEKMPSFFDENGVPQSDFSKHLMLWNRISWGVLINMATLEFRIKKYIFIADRIFELSTTPFDKYTSMNQDLLNNSYETNLQKHLKMRELKRKVRNFIYDPRPKKNPRRL